VIINQRACKRESSTYCGTIRLGHEGSPLLFCSCKPGGSRKLNGSLKFLPMHSAVHLLLGPVS
jgi:hypothetical protein